MKKIYIVIAAIVLIILIIISIFLSQQTGSTGGKPQINAPFPTSVPLPGNPNPVNPLSPTQTISSSTNANGNITGEPFDPSLVPFTETADFKAQFSSQLDKLVVVRKTAQGEQMFDAWAEENGYSQLVNNPNLVLLTDPGQTPHTFNPALDFFNFFTSFGSGLNSSTGSPAPTVTSQPVNNPKKTSSAVLGTGMTYYAQCGDEGNTPLPDGGTLCSAGCGPTSAAMIASSYVSKQYDPKAIVALYQKNNYLLGSSGSRYQDAHSLLSSLGLKTTDYLTFDSEKSDTVVPQLRNYINAGWTFFTLAYFCNGACGHYFWITGIDGQGNIMAYDPAYGRYQIPYNENTRYPFPLYLAAFGVKK